ncbi:Transthyretin-like family protein [Ancylostoma caninum]|uniref:Transthyretin-like family protein n=1 Tax=Ancylostoma caninum TaxID=29170 RepID=A0A368FPZ8_ANCCA|nr:Transthyretin-like family protein [Ancylostoma caninum]
MFLSALLALAFALAANAHTVTVRGKFYCQFNYELPVFIELMERDPFKDDLLEWQQIKVMEDFEITGTENEYRSITPYLRVFHKCRGVNEVATINFGRREGEATIDIGHLFLGDPQMMNEFRDKFAA